jgi:hypothetical protein
MTRRTVLPKPAATAMRGAWFPDPGDLLALDEHHQGWRGRLTAAAFRAGGEP